MDSLPLELFELFFDYLSFEERLLCRLVSKKFMQLIDKFRPVKSFILSENDLCILSRKWFDGDHQANNRQKFLTIYYMNKMFYKSALRMLNDLKYLIWYMTYDYEKENRLSIKLFKGLANFPQLERLQLEKAGSPDRYNHVAEIRLQKLWELTIKNFGIKNLILDLPSLTSLCLDLCESSSIRIDHPETVECAVFYRNNISLLSQLTNLKYLHLLYGDFLLTDHHFLSKHSELNKLHIEKTDIEVFSNIFDQKIKFGCDKLKIYFQGFCFKNLNQLLTYRYDIYRDDEFLKLCASNKLELADKILSLACLEYNDLEDKSIEFLSEIFKKLKNLNRLEVLRKVKNKDKLDQLIQSYGYFETLLFSNCQLSQDFFTNKLSNHKFIKELCLFDSFFEQDKKDFDLDFVFKMKHLQVLAVEKELTLDFVRRMHTNHIINFFKFEFKNKSCTILKAEPEDIDDLIEFNYLLIVPINQQKKFLYLDDLIDYLDKDF